MEISDKVYCFEIARRSVSRAALHLGIESMSQEALDSMADILLEYMGRVGKTLAHSVEASGRTSSHCNVLDAFAASDVVTSTSVSRLHFDAQENDSVLNRVGGSGGDGETTKTSSKGGTKQTPADVAGWQKLAEFCFGPKWLEAEVSGAKQRQSNGAVGGKQGPSATGDNDATSSKRKIDGWAASYLNEVPHFPQASQECSNPHCLNSKVALSLHPVDAPDEDTVDGEIASANQSNADIPDGVFTSVFGTGPMPNRKRKVDSMDVDSPTRMNENATASKVDAQTPPAKRVKINTTANTVESIGMPSSSNSDAAASEIDSEQDEARRPRFLPSFYPLPPRAIDNSKKRSIVDVNVDVPTNPTKVSRDNAPEHETAKSSASKLDGGDVKSSLVVLGGYWGSGWEASNDAPKKVSLAVPEGRVGEAASESSQAAAASATIVPLGRASGSRVSRILEGSMDAAAMQ